MPRQNVTDVDASSFEFETIDLLDGGRNVLFSMTAIGGEDAKYALNREAYVEPGTELQFVKGNGGLIAGEHIFYGYKPGLRPVIEHQLINALKVTALVRRGDRVMTAFGIRPIFETQYLEGWRIGLVLAPHNPNSTSPTTGVGIGL